MTGIRYRDAMTVLDAALPDGVDVVVDAGNTGAAAIHHLPVAARRPVRRGTRHGRHGLQLRRRDRHGVRRRASRGSTVVIAGDGAFFMHGMELHTAIQYRLPVTFVLFNNNAHAMCVTREQLFYDDLYSYNRFRPSRLGAGLAAMFPGLPSVDVDRHRRSCAARCGRRWTPTGRRWSASNAPPTKSRRSHRFSSHDPLFCPTERFDTGGPSDVVARA